MKNTQNKITKISKILNGLNNRRKKTNKELNRNRHMKKFSSSVDVRSAHFVGIRMKWFMRKWNNCWKCSHFGSFLTFCVETTVELIFENLLLFYLRKCQPFLLRKRDVGQSRKLRSVQTCAKGAHRRDRRHSARWIGYKCLQCRLYIKFNSVKFRSSRFYTFQVSFRLNFDRFIF